MLPSLSLDLPSAPPAPPTPLSPEDARRYLARAAYDDYMRMRERRTPTPPSRRVIMYRPVERDLGTRSSGVDSSLDEAVRYSAHLEGSDYLSHLVFLLLLFIAISCLVLSSALVHQHLAQNLGD
jgi:hypothetical protein